MCPAYSAAGLAKLHVLGDPLARLAEATERRIGTRAQRAVARLSPIRMFASTAGARPGGVGVQGYDGAVPLVEVNGVRLAVQDAGQGAPIVLVHGSWDDRHVWAFVEGNLTKSFRVVSYDRRGHSDSEDSPEAGNQTDDEDDLAALIEALDLAPAHLVASSFGGSIALGLAARRPELVRSICAHEPPLLSLAADDPVVANFTEGVAPAVSLIDHGETEAGAKLFVEQVTAPGAWDDMSSEEQAKMIRNAGTFPDDFRDCNELTIDLDALAHFPSSVLLTGGDESPPFFGKIITRLVEVMESAQMRVLPGAGHEPHLTHPDLWLAVVSEFVAGAN